MREAWSRIAILHRSLNARLGARRRPSLRGVLRKFAHFHASPVGFRFLAMAITGPRVGGTQVRARIRGKDQRASQQKKQQSRASHADGPPRACAEGWKMHWPILRPTVQKTDSAGSPKILLLGSWNWVGHQRGEQGQCAQLPDSVLSSSELNSRGRSGVGRKGTESVQVLINE